MFRKVLTIFISNANKKLIALLTNTELSEVKALLV